MSVQHSAITDPNIHEPKGASTASAGMVYVADGVGSGDWKLQPHAYCYYSNIGTGTTYTTPTSYTLINPTTSGDAAPIGFTHNSAGRLTYTGTDTIDISFTATVTLKHSTGAGNDCYFAFHKNGTIDTPSISVISADSTTYMSTTILGHVSMATNDYVELFCKVAAGNIIVHSFKVLAHGHV